MDDYITQYNSTEDIEERNIIYNNHLYQPMLKMAESIFNRFKFQYIEYEPQDVLMDVVSHLTSKLHCFDKSKGKSYSWASITIKFWLINNNNNTYKYRKNTDSLDSIISDNIEVIDITESPDMINDQHLLIDSMWNEWDSIVDYYNKHPKVGKVGPSWMKILHGTDKVIKSKSDKKE